MPGNSAQRQVVRQSVLFLERNGGHEECAKLVEQVSRALRQSPCASVVLDIRAVTRCQYADKHLPQHILRQLLQPHVGKVTGR